MFGHDPLGTRHNTRRRGPSGLRVIGLREPKGTLRVREFLARNLVPFTWMDLEDDPQVKQFLDRLG